MSRVTSLHNVFTTSIAILHLIMNKLTIDYSLNKTSNL